MQLQSHLAQGKLLGGSIGKVEDGERLGRQLKVWEEFDVLMKDDWGRPCSGRTKLARYRFTLRGMVSFLFH